MTLNEQEASNKALGRTIMIQGTASDVGKSLITAALCRVFTKDGWRVAPFKSQNMSLNSYVTWDGKEIGRAQGMQADACGILATTDMNPILLKPTGEMSSQVVVHGKPLRDYHAVEYRENYLPTAGGIVREALQRLREANDIVVLEGAGSPAEINLKDRDIVNMRMAAWADAPVILAADIDRGGVFASIVGTLELLEPSERDRICGFIINKFRGDVSLLQPGLDWLEARTGKPVIGVLSFMPGLELEDEDSLSLSKQHAAVEIEASNQKRELDIAVIRLPRISNFTDMDPLRFETDVHLRYIEHAGQWGSPDAVILPGSKNTIEDFVWLKETGLADLVQKHAAGGGAVAGICGGYEMLGTRLYDPLHVESSVEETEGLGLFPFEVRFTAEKRTVRVSGTGQLSETVSPVSVEGYEIHMGEVIWRMGEESIQRPFQIKEQTSCSDLEASSRYTAEGASANDGKQWGTFIHGILHNDDFRRQWLNGLREAKGLLSLPADLRFHERREAAFDRLAEHARRYLNIPLIYELLGHPKEGT
ncbi:cobyric acid synthase [Paenibacillus sp. LHD-38]|uniref:cobyric acid synthase n=1 Tax=Paenibacillus sp. LHD-38 TaxID=3072143 RepID=UPI00280F00FA|nr:cobyric acid synthase [Paenibacillus sp. LHD-38]MDQ8735266.1 cobyric acid synthase [Paenibacillus sp. LHD-38]